MFQLFCRHKLTESKIGYVIFLLSMMKGFNNLHYLSVDI